jgi:hypothetical protein
MFNLARVTVRLPAVEPSQPTIPRNQYSNRTYY